MGETVLITGGAGFIGSHLADAYLRAGYHVRVLDKLVPQVHGKLHETGKPPAYLSKEVEFISGDVCDRETVRKAMRGAHVLSHHAAVVGVGQSMYEIASYTQINSYGTAVVLDCLANESHTVRKVIVASSMSVYGDGAYVKPSTGEKVYPPKRPLEKFQKGDWEMRDKDGEVLLPVPTNEEKPLFPSSVYAINKRDQEEMVLTVGRAYNIPSVAFRYFNTFGCRQALSNPYTGVIAIFCARLLNHEPPVIFEDGLQQRDFVDVRDVAQANVLATRSSAADFEVLNVGSGKSITIGTIAGILKELMHSGIEPVTSLKFREGDVRHCFADISKIQSLLGWKPQYDFRTGVQDVMDWVKSQTADDRLQEMKRHLEKHGLVK